MFIQAIVEVGVALGKVGFASAEAEVMGCAARLSPGRIDQLVEGFDPASICFGAATVDAGGITIDGNQGDTWAASHDILGAAM